MSLFILDTDHLTLLYHGHPAISQRIASHAYQEIATTIITVEEQLTGWYSEIRKARKPEMRARAYEGLFRITEGIKKIQVLPFTLRAVQSYEDLRKQFPRHGKMDLSIVAIALEHQGVLITRNRQDFDPVAGLQIEDWSQ